jgi:hypothetical protein
MKKVCKTCGEKKDLSEFHKQEKSPDGKQPNCKPCRAKYNNKYIKTDWLKMVIG